MQIDYFILHLIDLFIKKLYLHSQHLFQSFKYNNTYYTTYVHSERGLERNPLTYIKEPHIRLIFSQQFLQEQNPVINWGSHLLCQALLICKLLLQSYQATVFSVMWKLLVPLLASLKSYT